MSDEINEDSSSSGSSSSAAEEERVLRKGRWKAWEDDILQDYVGNNGEGNWNSIKKHTRLARCGKSCRVRWLNHLKPGLKKGPVTPFEEYSISRLHSQNGNKWSLISARMPGRTDSYIKNYWYTRAKRHRRHGRVENPQTQNANRGLQIGGLRPHTVSFTPASNQVYLPVNHGSMARGYGMFGQELRYDDVRSVNQNVLFRRLSEPGSFVPPNVRFSTPRPVTGTVLSELPSLQYPETDCSWGTCPPPPPYHAIPSYIQPTPPMALSTQSDSASQSFGSHARSTVREQSSENSSNYSTMFPIAKPEYSLAEVSRFMEIDFNDGISLDDLLDFDGTLGLEKTEPSAGQTSTPDVVEKDVSDAGDSQKPQ